MDAFKKMHPPPFELFDKIKASSCLKTFKESSEVKIRLGISVTYQECRGDLDGKLSAYLCIFPGSPANLQQDLVIVVIVIIWRKRRNII